MGHSSLDSRKNDAPDKPGRDFGLQLVQQGIATLNIGTPGGDAWNPDKGEVRAQPLSYYAYVAANAWLAMAQHAKLNPEQIGVAGHSYGGKWALFAAALWDHFAAVAVSDPGIVFDETRPNVNYWEPWYLGWDPETTRPARGIPSDQNNLPLSQNIRPQPVYRLNSYVTCLKTYNAGFMLEFC